MDKFLANACKSYVVHEMVCLDGFPQLANCRDPQVTTCCGKYRGMAPHCMREDLPEHFLRDNGGPRLYPRPSRPNTDGSVPGEEA